MRIKNYSPFTNSIHFNSVHFKNSRNSEAQPLLLDRLSIGRVNGLCWKIICNISGYSGEIQELGSQTARLGQNRAGPGIRPGAKRKWGCQATPIYVLLTWA